VCTQKVVHTMLKDSDTTLFPTRRSHRTYTKQFKAELVAACQQPGCSIAALAGRHAMNVNVLHRWLKEYERSGLHQLEPNDPSSAVNLQLTSPAFVPVKFAAPAREATEQAIKLELRKGAVSMTITWPASAAGDLAHWTRTVLG
jgi:transposase-like protein